MVAGEELHLLLDWSKVMWSDACMGEAAKIADGQPACSSKNARLVAQK